MVMFCKYLSQQADQCWEVPTREAGACSHMAGECLHLLKISSCEYSSCSRYLGLIKRWKERHLCLAVFGIPQLLGYSVGSKLPSPNSSICSRRLNLPSQAKPLSGCSVSALHLAHYLQLKLFHFV